LEARHQRWCRDEGKECPTSLPNRLRAQLVCSLSGIRATTGFDPAWGATLDFIAAFGGKEYGKEGGERNGREREKGVSGKKGKEVKKGKRRLKVNPFPSKNCGYDLVVIR